MIDLNRKTVFLSKGENFKNKCEIGSLNRELGINTGRTQQGEDEIKKQ